VADGQSKSIFTATEFKKLNSPVKNSLQVTAWARGRLGFSFAEVTCRQKVEGENPGHVVDVIHEVLNIHT
jgi:hypothetical protein